VDNPVGIDLGTTYSAVAWMQESGHTAMIPNAEGDILTPSTVLFDTSEIVVGKQAKKAGPLRPDRYAETVKPTQERCRAGARAGLRSGDYRPRLFR
jgi:molecular chaperone DnaK